MVIVKTWIPNYSEVSPLERLRSPVSIHGYVGSWRGHNCTLKLIDSNDEIVFLDAEYDDVKFKFECYFVAVGQADSHNVEWYPDRIVEDWKSIRLLIGFEWDRPARPGELPDHYEQTVGDMSARENIPDNILALGVFVHGFVFWHDTANKPIAAIVASHDVPGTLEILSDRDQLDAVLAICEVVDIPSLDAWTTDLNKWLDRMWDFHP